MSLRGRKVLLLNQTGRLAPVSHPLVLVPRRKPFSALSNNLKAKAKAQAVAAAEQVVVVTP